LSISPEIAMLAPMRFATSPGDCGGYGGPPRHCIFRSAGRSGSGPTVGLPTDAISTESWISVTKGVRAACMARNSDWVCLLEGQSPGKISQKRLLFTAEPAFPQLAICQYHARRQPLRSRSVARRHTPKHCWASQQWHPSCFFFKLAVCND